MVSPSLHYAHQGNIYATSHSRNVHRANYLILEDLIQSIQHQPAKQQEHFQEYKEKQIHVIQAYSWKSDHFIITVCIREESRGGPMSLRWKCVLQKKRNSRKINLTIDAAASLLPPYSRPANTPTTVAVPQPTVPGILGLPWINTTCDQKSFKHYQVWAGHRYKC